MKSELIINRVNFSELMERVRAYVRLRIHSGEYTERSLARVLRVSQPHLHNVLKGVRRMNVELADQVLARFRISILDLLGSEEILSAWDEKDPEWLSRAAKRKPAARASKRKHDERVEWRTGSADKWSG